MARKRIATPAEGMPPKRGAHRGAHPETAKSCLGTGEVEKCHTVQIGEISGGGRAEAKPVAATAGADPEPAKSLVNAAARREALEKCREIALQWQADEAAGVAGTTDKPHSRSAAEAVIDMEFEINAALSAPPRNCDVGTAEEQSARYDAQCDAYHKTTGKCDDCPIYKEECKMTGNIPHCQLVWAQMPYNESEVK